MTSAQVGRPGLPLSRALRVAVVGCSIGGLTAGLLLRDLGCDVRVYERSRAELDARGAGIAVLDATVRYFVERTSVDPDAFCSRTSRIRYLWPDGSCRYSAEHRYRIHTVPAVTPVLQFIQQHARQDDREAYSTLNMGAGFAIFVRAEDAQRTVEVARAQGIEAIVAGQVEAGPKELLIEPLNIRFGNDDLQLR